MQLTIRLVFIIFFTSLMSGQNLKTSEIDEFIRKIRNQLNLKTGMAVSVVVNDKKVFSEGYGYLNIEKEIEAAGNSPFYIASSTKSFTAALFQLLSEKDTLSIDKPVAHYVPRLDFENEIFNPAFITIRDLLTHRSGIFSIPSVVRTAYTGQHSFEELIKVYKSARFTTREFKYTNDGYVIASMILDNIYESPWQELLQQHIFDPLNMENTSCWVSENDRNLLCAYRTVRDDVKNIGFLKRDNTMHAAGGMISTAEDLANWLKFNLNNGIFNGDTILSPNKLNEAHSSQISCDLRFWNYRRYAYGLGWYLSDYGGEKLIHHFGGYGGARSHISFMPEHVIGVAALTNDDGAGYYAVDLIADFIYNSFLGKEAEKTAREELKIIIDKNKKNKSRTADVNLSNDIESRYNLRMLTGDYINEEFGRVKIVLDPNLKFKFGNLISDLIPISENKFSAEFAPFGADVSFTEINGEVNELIFEGPTSIVFKKNQD